MSLVQEVKLFDSKPKGSGFWVHYYTDELLVCMCVSVCDFPPLSIPRSES